MPLVISDSSILIHLTRIDRLSLLEKMFGKIAVPPNVWLEVVEKGAGRVGVTEISSAHELGWIEVVAPKQDALLRLLSRELDGGEAEVIALAVERQADLVLLDEWEARRIADLYSLQKTGTIGILMRAKRDRHIESLRQEIDKLRHHGGFWVDEPLYLRALSAVGEKPDT
jgi:uncharacterized protein